MQFNINELYQSNYCIFLYKDGSVGYIEEKDIKGFFNSKKISYVLIPIMSDGGIGFLPIMGQYFIPSIKSCKITYQLMISSVQTDYEELYDFKKVVMKPKNIIEFYNSLYSLKRLSAFNYIINWEAHDEYDILDLKEFSLSLKKGDNENIDLNYQFEGSYLSDSIEDKPMVDYIVRKLERKHIFSVPDFYNVKGSSFTNPQIFIVEKNSGLKWQVKPFACAENDQLFGIQSNLTDTIYFIDKFNYGLMKAYTMNSAELHIIIVNAGDKRDFSQFEPDLISIEDLFNCKNIWFCSIFSMGKPHELIDVISNINYFKMCTNLLFSRNIPQLSDKNYVIARFLLPDNFLGDEFQYKPINGCYQINRFLWELNSFKDSINRIYYDLGVIK